MTSYQDRGDAPNTPSDRPAPTVPVPGAERSRDSDPTIDPRGANDDAFARVLESSGDALVVLDHQWRYVYVNGPAVTLIGRPRAELLGRAVTEVFPGFDQTPFRDIYQRAVREQALLTVEEFFEPLGRWFDVRAIPLGGMLYLHFRDVSAQKQAQKLERAFEERERARLTDIFMQAPAFMGVVRGADHVFEMVNPPYLQLVGHRGDLIGRPVAEAVPEVVEQGFIDLLDRVYRTGEPFVGTEVPILLQRTPDGPPERRFLDFTYQPLRDADGRVTGILAHGIDLTERKRAQDALRASQEALRDTAERLRGSQERLEIAFESVRLGMWELDPRTGEQVWSGEQERLFGLERGGFGGSVDSFLDRVHPEDRGRVAEYARRAFADPSTTEYEDEFRIVRADTGAGTGAGTGEVRWLHGRARIERDPATGEALRVTGVNLDITERKRREERERFLADLSERTRALLAPEEVAWEAMRATGEFVWASRCVFVEVDEETGTLTAARDWTREGVQSAAGTYPAASFGEAALAVLRSGEALVVNDARSDARIPEKNRGAYEAIETLSLVSVPILRGGRWVGILGVNDTSPRRWTPEEVELLRQVAERTWLAIENARLFRRAQQDETRFRALIDASSQMVWRTGADGLIVDMPEWRAYTGQSEEQVRGFGWVDAIHPEDRDRVAETWREAFEARSPYHAEYRVRGGDGVYRWYAARGVPLFGEDGSLREYIGTWASVDERHRAEQERAENLRRERRRADQLRQLTEASLVINSTASLSEMFQAICDKAREIIGAHQSVVSITRGEDWSQAINAVSLSDKYAAWRDYATLPDGSGIYALVCRENRILRLTHAELTAHPAWRGFGAHAAEHPPMNGWLAVPLVARDGKNLGLIQLSDKYDGEFTEGDETILVQLAQLASVAIENQRLLEEERARAARQAVLNRINTALRSSLDPEVIEKAAVTILGEALGVDRCYMVSYHVAENYSTVACEYRSRPDELPPMAGRYVISEYGEVMKGLYRSPEPQAVADVRQSDLDRDAVAKMEALGMRAYVRVPFYEGGTVVSGIGVAMADTPRAWTPEEVELVQTAAVQVRAVLEVARAHKELERDRAKQRRIAETLQDAMLLAPPEDAFSGLSVGTHYEPAWDEALIGGDFYDALQLDDGRVALICGDGTGKGLEAARYVSESLFVLRAYLRESPDPALALTRLNNYMIDGQRFDGRAENALAAVAVAVIDTHTGGARFAAGGAEPPLVVRAATGRAEQVQVSGVVLGANPKTEYDSVSVTLNAGDLIVMSTDGTTEARNRQTRQFFGYEGLLHAAEGASFAVGSLNDAARLLVERAKEFAGGRLGDDACVVIGCLRRGADSGVESVTP